MTAMLDGSEGVRHARPDDLGRLLPIVNDLLSEALFQSLRAGYVEEVVERCLTRGIVGVIEHEDDVAATVGLAIDRFEHTDESHVRVFWLGASAAQQRSDYAQRLLRFAEWCQHAMVSETGEGLPLVIPAHTSRDLIPKLRLYERRVPLVEARFAFGCSPDYLLTADRRAGERRGGPGLSGGPGEGGWARQSIDIGSRRRA